MMITDKKLLQLAFNAYIECTEHIYFEKFKEIAPSAASAFK